MSQVRFTASIENPLAAAIDVFKVRDRRRTRNAALNELLYRHPELQKILSEGVTHPKAKRKPAKGAAK
ncbi:hypothetical protein [Terrimicrobium sacchariphilum]|uniref:hypothetical protein n=1 Tax=Terrimicrobium sacchariphilum TaxID=690879 RepID=UPI00129C0280|nr:hypothetical protein [Terrimicrobium sacchariphilum]